MRFSWSVAGLASAAVRQRLLQTGDHRLPRSAAGPANSGKADRPATTAQESLIQFLENPKFSPRGE